MVAVSCAEGVWSSSGEPRLTVHRVRLLCGAAIDFCEGARAQVSKRSYLDTAAASLAKGAAPHDQRGAQRVDPRPPATATGQPVREERGRLCADVVRRLGDAGQGRVEQARPGRVVEGHDADVATGTDAPPT